MSIRELAEDYAALCKAGKSDEAGHKYWSDDVVSIEAMTPPGGSAESRGVEAVKAKGAWWYGTHDVHKANVTGPFVNGDQFQMIFDIDVTNKESGQRVQMEEVGLYTVRDGKVIEERFFS